MQLTPSPLKPGLQLQWKLPKVLLQVAFSWQLSNSVVHSSMSIKCMHIHIYYDHVRSIYGILRLWLQTYTCKSISSKAGVAQTVITSKCVYASCIWVTIIQPSFTLRNVCNRMLKACSHITHYRFCVNVYLLCRMLLLYLCSWIHSLQNLPYMYSWSFHLCQCS